MHRLDWPLSLLPATGRIQLPNGAEYVGRFHAGLAHGAGRYFDIDGETFEGEFQRGLLHGRALVKLPNGRTYHSVWANGVELPGSRRLRLAQQGQIEAPADDVHIGIVVNRLPDTLLKTGVGGGGRLGYASSSSSDGLSVQPNFARLMALWKGDSSIELTKTEEYSDNDGEYGVFSLPPVDVAPVSLTLEIENRSASPAQISRVIVDVESSTIDPQPAIQISVGALPGECHGRPRLAYSPRFLIENFGWGPPSRRRSDSRLPIRMQPSRPSNFPIPKISIDCGNGERKSRRRAPCRRRQCRCSERAGRA